MKLYKPTQILDFQLHTGSWYYGVPWEDLDVSGPAIIPLFSRVLEELEVEGRFSQTYHRRENFVHHTKLDGLYFNIPPFLFNERASWGQHKDQQLQILPLCQPQSFESSSKCIAWICRPGYTLIIYCMGDDRIYGYNRALYFEAHILKADYSANGRAEHLTFRYLTKYYSPAKDYFHVSSNSSSDTSELLNSDFALYFSAKIQGLPNWSMYDHGSNNSDADYALEKQWNLRMFTSVVDDLFAYERIAIATIKDYNSFSSYRLRTVTPIAADFNAPSTLFGEEYIMEQEDIILCNNLPGYVFEELRQKSFLSACEAAPVMSDNSISNLLELTSFIYDLVVRHEINIPASLSDLWLAYRYQYATTKLDVEDAIAFVHRHVDKSMWDKGLKSYGEASTTFGGASITMRAAIVMAKREMSQIREIWDKLRTFGLTPDFYVIWDMLPYSFIVDWFIPIGNVLNAIDQSLEYTEEHYQFKKIVYSLTYRLQDDNNLTWKVYTRWPEEHPPSLSGYYWFLNDASSKRTVQFRAVDTAALIIGRMKGG